VVEAFERVFITNEMSVFLHIKGNPFSRNHLILSYNHLYNQYDGANDATLFILMIRLITFILIIIISVIISSYLSTIKSLLLSHLNHSIALTFIASLHGCDNYPFMIILVPRNHHLILLSMQVLVGYLKTKILSFVWKEYHRIRR
jgi:hypothetical protein